MKVSACADVQARLRKRRIMRSACADVRARLRKRREEGHWAAHQRPKCERKKEKVNQEQERWRYEILLQKSFFGGVFLAHPRFPSIRPHSDGFQQQLVKLPSHSSGVSCVVRFQFQNLLIRLQCLCVSVKNHFVSLSNLKFPGSTFLILNKFCVFLFIAF